MTLLCSLDFKCTISCTALNILHKSSVEPCDQQILVKFIKYLVLSSRTNLCWSALPFLLFSTVSCPTPGNSCSVCLPWLYLVDPWASWRSTRIDRYEPWECASLDFFELIFFILLSFKEGTYKRESPKFLWPSYRKPTFYRMEQAHILCVFQWSKKFSVLRPDGSVG